MKLLSFDVEISDVIPEDVDDISKYAPFHISVAATAILGGAEELWYSECGPGVPALNIYPDRARALLEYLEDMIAQGYMVCAWNGLNFDFRWLGFIAEDMKLATRIAVASYDPMFQFFNRRGFPIALAKVAEGMGVEQKKLMHGADAPRKWREGKYDEVMEYVLGDCQITNAITALILERGHVRWITARGKNKREPMPRLKTVAEVIGDPMADQSWMDDPMSKASFYEWFPLTKQQSPEQPELSL